MSNPKKTKKAEPKKWFEVRIPITGTLSVRCEATNEEEAKAKAWEQYDEGHYDEDEDLSWEAVEPFREMPDEIDAEEC